MYSYEDRIRAVKLYIRLGKRARPNIQPKPGSRATLPEQVHTTSLTNSMPAPPPPYPPSRLNCLPYCAGVTVVPLLCSRWDSADGATLKGTNNESYQVS